VTTLAQIAYKELVMSAFQAFIWRMGSASHALRRFQIAHYAVTQLLALSVQMTLSL